MNDNDLKTVYGIKPDYWSLNQIKYFSFRLKTKDTVYENFVVECLIQYFNSFLWDSTSDRYANVSAAYLMRSLIRENIVHHLSPSAIGALVDGLTCSASIGVITHLLCNLKEQNV